MSEITTSRTTAFVSRPGLSEMFAWTIPIAAALVHFLEFDIAGKSSTGWMWIGYLFGALGLYQIEITFDRNQLITIPIKVWGAWYGFIWLTLAWCPGIGGRNIQDAMMITMPLVIGVLTSMVFRTPQQLERFLAAFVAAIVILFFRFVCTQVGIADPESQPGARIIAITSTFLACVCLAYSIRNTSTAYAGWFVCLTMAAGSVSRMATGIMMLMPILNPNFRNRWARFLLVAAMPFCGLAIFYSPSFQQRFFYSGHGTISDVLQGNFLSFGRLEAWPAIFDEACDRFWLGHGVGTVVEFVPTVWPEEDKPHNEYLRVFYECGIVGVILFVWSMVWQMRDLYRRVKMTDGTTSVAFAACLMGWFGFAIFSATDNVLIYNLFYNNLLFALMGAAYGVASNTEARCNGETRPAGNLP